MFKYIVKRLLQSIVTILLIVTVVFLLMRLMPTDYFFTEDELIKLTDEQKELKLQAAGLTDPPLVQLGNFYKNMFTFDYTYEQGKKDAITAQLSGGGMAEAVHAAIADTLNAELGEEAAASVISKQNTKVLTDTLIQKYVSEGLQIEDCENNEAVAQAIAQGCVGKLATLQKDLKKLTPDEDAAKALTQKVYDAIGVAVAGQMMGVDLKIKAEGFANIINHLNPLNWKVTFDLGTSRRIQSGVSVIEVIGEKFPVSMRLGLISLAFALVIGVVLGILQARYKGSVLDSVCSGYTIFINAVPHLVSYTLIMYLCSSLFGLPMTYKSATPVASAIPPILCLSTGSIASYMLWMRRYMVDELNKDYIRLAQLKGLTRTQVMFRHVMKNAFLPLAQYLPYNVLLTVGGSLLAESFFSVPGMGPLLTLAISRYDTNLVQAIVMLYATLGIAGVFLGDLLLAILDPRISLTGKKGAR